MHVSNLRKKIPDRDNGMPWFKTIHGLRLYVHRVINYAKIFLSFKCSDLLFALIYCIAVVSVAIIIPTLDQRRIRGSTNR